MFAVHLIAARSTDLPRNKNKFTTHISGLFNGTIFRCAHMGYMRFPKRTKHVTDRFLSRFWVFFHFNSSQTTWYWVFYDEIVLNLRVSFLFKLFLFIGKSVLSKTTSRGARETFYLLPPKTTSREHFYLIQSKTTSRRARTFLLRRDLALTPGPRPSGI